MAEFSHYLEATTMIRKYKPDDTDALIAIWDAADAMAHPFLPSKVKDQVRQDMRNIYLPNAQSWVPHNNRSGRRHSRRATFIGAAAASACHVQCRRRHTHRRTQTQTSTHV